MALKLTLRNLNVVNAEIQAFPQDIEKIINNEFKAFGDNMSNDAKRLAPVNEGALRESIAPHVGSLSIAVGAYIEYAAYLEFGTKSFAEAYVAGLPADWQEFSAQYKGSGEGTFADLIKAIMKWVELKGIAKGKDIKQASYLIACKIVRFGIKPHPYLYPAFEKNKIDLIANLKRELNVK